MSCEKCSKIMRVTLLLFLHESLKKKTQKIMKKSEVFSYSIKDNFNDNIQI